jgi:hypothetical protein
MSAVSCSRSTANFGEEFEKAPMINTGNKATDEAAEIGLPTVQEFWESIEDDFNDVSEIQRPTPIGLTSTSRKLARNWQAILDDSSASQISSDHYLSESQVVASPHEIDSFETEFAVALASFLMARLNERLHEVRRVQLQLQDELARFLPQ